MHYDDNKPKYIRYAIYAGIMIFSFILQSSGISLPEICGARPLLIIPLCVCVAMHEREIPASIFGAAGGILMDTASGTEGFNALILTVLCAVCSILISHLMQNNIVTALVLCSGTVAVYELFYIIVNYGFGGAGNVLTQVFTFYLPVFVYTLLFVPVFYYIIRHVFTTHKNG